MEVFLSTASIPIPFQNSNTESTSPATKRSIVLWLLTGKCHDVYMDHNSADCLGDTYVVSLLLLSSIPPEYYKYVLPDVLPSGAVRVRDTRGNESESENESAGQSRAVSHLAISKTETRWSRRESCC